MNERFKLGRASISAMWYLLLVIILPGATLLVGGLFFLWEKQLLLPVVVMWLLVLIIAYAALIYWPKRQSQRRLAKAHTDLENSLDETADAPKQEDLPQRLQARYSWTEKDHGVWQRCCGSIETQLQHSPQWQALPELALEQLTFIAQEYHGSAKNAQFRFTVPELLLVISVTSSRYRQLLIDHVPFIDQFSIATGSLLINQKDNISSSYRWFNRVRRTTRLLNPATAVVGELRDLISNKLFAQASEAVQNDLKRLFLQEAVQVGIDLYSGKLNVSDDEVAGYTSRTSIADDNRRADTAEPIRIMLLGQTSVGKSSLVNALTDALQAEVDILPVTNRLTVHELHMDDQAVISLIDTPGIDGSAANHGQLLNAAMEADLILWLAKATQPARAPDQQLLEAINSHYSMQTAKLKPPTILVLTNIDQLSPKSQWEPPYDLAGEQPKAKSIVAAASAAKHAIGFSEKTLTVPVYVGDTHAHYNVDALAAQIMMLSDSSLNVQLNRRRLELESNANDWKARWSQTKKLGRVIGQTIVKKVR